MIKEVCVSAIQTIFNFDSGRRRRRLCGRGWRLVGDVGRIGQRGRQVRMWLM